MLLMRVRIVPYKLGSKSSRLLAKGLDVLRINTPNTRFIPRHNDVLINWGCSASPFVNSRGVWLNHPNSVSNASNKLRAFQLFKEASVSIPDFATNKEDAKALFDSDSVIVYCRTRLCGKGGAGIVLAKNVDELVDAPLYTKGILNSDEFRIHVFKGEVFDVVQKRKRTTDADPTIFNEHIRNHDNGWIFAREGVAEAIDDAIKNTAISAISSLFLDFGAVDIRVDRETKQAYILEVNTAPGITGTTETNYVNKFRAYFE